MNDTMTVWQKTAPLQYTQDLCKCYHIRLLKVAERPKIDALFGILLPYTRIFISYNQYSGMLRHLNQTPHGTREKSDVANYDRSNLFCLFCFV